MTDFFGISFNGDEYSSINTEEQVRLFSILQPKSSPFNLMRIGKRGDGAYLLPDDLAGIKACYSPGVNNFKDFEDVLTNIYSIKCHMCDKSSDPERFRTPLIAGMQTFQKKWLDIDRSDDSISLGDWISENNPDANDDLILQMDIEGAEYRNILNSSDATLKRFRIMVVEFHGLDSITDPTVLSKVLIPTFSKIDRHFQCVHAHANNYCENKIIPATTINLPSLVEFTFLRRDRLKIHTQNPLKRVDIPHPLDITNVPHKPPLFLNENWAGGKRSMKSRLKILNDWTYFTAYSSARRVWNLFR